MNDDDLQQIGAELHRTAEDAVPGPDCPSADRIWGAVRRELPAAERLAVLDHTVECAACAEAWRIAMSLGAHAVFGAASNARPSWRAMWTFPRAAAAALAVAATVFLVARLVWPPDQGLQPPPPGSPRRPPSAIVVSLNVGDGPITLTANGTLTTPSPLAPADEARIRRALLERTFAAAPQLAELKTGAAPLMGGASGSRFALTAPVATLVIADRPAFRWSPLDDALDYEVTISDIASNYREVASSGALRTSTWTVPAALPRGRTYSWQVVARTRAGELKAPAAGEPEARFRVLPSDAAERLSSAVSARPDDHLQRGLLFAEAGVLDEADAEFRALAAANPGSSVAADLLRALRQLRETRRRGQ